MDGWGSKGMIELFPCAPGFALGCTHVVQPDRCFAWICATSENINLDLGTGEKYIHKKLPQLRCLKQNQVINLFPKLYIGLGIHPLNKNHLESPYQHSPLQVSSGDFCRRGVSGRFRVLVSKTKVMVSLAAPGCATQAICI